ncbi:hypothetical protein SAMN02746089_02138 [Caldanaerobius fijiensis DSM 17918]|uniref:Amidohydrolase-related domain-containing protein n=1 Tax=Caldanaerobius fijiensis DSM 17918 TaxID=1121256 RepID=A0A1M5CJ76_9THEO|nr:hypothetical protein SAMN02746089_02138 [Caldanaerobius fijiensis DSM 17918]
MYYSHNDAILYAKLLERKYARLKNVIDFHAHAFPDKVASKAVANLSKHYSLKIERKGTLKDLINSAKEGGIHHIVVHSTATNPEHVETVNNWIASITGNGIIGFGTIHPDYPFIEKELCRILKLGLKGLKLHPDFQGFYIDDPKMMPIYEMIGSRMPVLFHLGDERLDYSSPRRLARVINNFPHMIIIGAHLGGYARWDEAMEYLIGKNIYIDTSSSLWRLDTKKAVTLIKKHGVEKVLFGTDYPITSHKSELERFMKLKLSTEEKEKILWENGRKLLKLQSTFEQAI